MFFLSSILFSDANRTCTLRNMCVSGTLLAQTHSASQQTKRNETKRMHFCRSAISIAHIIFITLDTLFASVRLPGCARGRTTTGVKRHHDATMPTTPRQRTAKMASPRMSALTTLRQNDETTQRRTGRHLIKFRIASAKCKTVSSVAGCRLLLPPPQHAAFRRF